MQIDEPSSSRGRNGFAGFGPSSQHEQTSAERRVQPNALGQQVCKSLSRVWAVLTRVSSLVSSIFYALSSILYLGLGSVGLRCRLSQANLGDSRAKASANVNRARNSIGLAGQSSCATSLAEMVQPLGWWLRGVRVSSLEPRLSSFGRWMLLVEARGLRVAHSSAHARSRASLEPAARLAHAGEPTPSLPSLPSQLRASFGLSLGRACLIDNSAYNTIIAQQLCLALRYINLISGLSSMVGIVCC